MRYLDLLEKTFVLTQLGGFSSNLRNEITAKYKYYFLDLGIRNVVIAQFNPLAMRNDIGQLWENFIYIIRLKKQVYTGFYGNRYFWRNYSGQEIDFIEEIENMLTPFKAKWPITKKEKNPPAWKKLFPICPIQLITPQNYLSFIT